MGEPLSDWDSGPPRTTSQQWEVSAPSSWDRELIQWLTELHLGQYAEEALRWCAGMGAAQLSEVQESWQEFAAALQLKPLERKRLEKASEKASAASPHGKEEKSPVADGAGGTGGQSSQSAGKAVEVIGSRASRLGSFGPNDDPGRYTLLEEIGSGATATVYRCRRGDHIFAVKNISLSKLKLQRDFQRIADKLYREVSILYSLRHPRIVSLFDVVEGQEKLHLVMELVEGGELFDHIVSKGRLPEAEARYIFLQITEGLQYIHSKDIVYRDLKPENILVDAKASRPGLLEVKLSDFGHSKLVNDGYSTALTRVGTPQYWAPEVSDPALAAKGYDQRVDLWSLGVVLYVMLMGVYPFDGIAGPMEEQIRQAKLSFNFYSPGEVPSDGVKDLISSLVKAKPADRLALSACLSHSWAAMAGGALDKVLKLCSESKAVAEERLVLPTKPSREQVELLRRDLNHWTSKHRCFATLKYNEVVASLGPPLTFEEQEAARKELVAIINYLFGREPLQPQKAPTGEARRRFKVISLYLRVSTEGGAGLELNPEHGGMRVDEVLPHPGQPGMLAGDLITSINEISLRGNPSKVEAIFRVNFKDGVLLSLKREL